MHISDVADFLDSCYNMRSEMVPLLIGNPGIGKTQGVYEFAKSKGVKVVELWLSQMSPLEISGMTMPNEQDHSMQVFDSKRLDSLEDGDVLFLDELLQAPQQTLTACLTLIQERKMLSGKDLPDIFIVAAANPLPQKYDGLPTSIRQRFMAVNVEAKNKEVSDYIKAELDIEISEADLVFLLGKHSKSTEGFNVVTPRTLVKLLKFAKDIPLDKAIDYLNEIVDEEFATRISAILRSRLVQEDKETIENLVKDVDIDAAKFIKEHLDSMSIKEILRYLNDEALLDAIGDEMKNIMLKSVTS